MKAKLIYSLPDDKQEFDVASRAVDLYLSLWDLDNWLRGISKHGETDMISVDDVRDQLREIMGGHGVSLGMMD